MDEIWKLAEDNISEYNLDLKNNGIPIRNREEHYLISFIPPLLVWDEKATKKNFYCVNNVHLYLHIPFCEIICSFCHLNKIKLGSDHSIVSLYVDSIIRELKYYFERFPQRVTIKSIQFGGGTPSILSARELDKILSAIHKYFIIDNDCELKFEFLADTNPNKYADIVNILGDFGKLKGVVDLQTKSSEILKKIGRKKQTYNEYLKTIDFLKENGVGEIITSLIIGLPKDSRGSLESTLRALASHESVSTITGYPLMFKSSDPLFRLLKNNKEYFLSEYERDVMEEFMTLFMKEHNFIESPINFFSRTNIDNIQQNGKYNSDALIGVGAGAFGYIPSKKSQSQYINTPNISHYINSTKMNQLPIWKSTDLSLSEFKRKKLILKLGTLESFEISQELQDKTILNELNYLSKLDYILLYKGRCRLLPKGRRRYTEVGTFLMDSLSINKILSYSEHQKMIRSCDFDLFPSYDTNQLKNILQTKAYL
ncbi:oxygen-independent coproporphyrinogen III oxidase [Pseudoalteromonas ulvae UL12]|uniref:radical SAM protein n=1 Tax=Pseudoalteromonas ulvae TaxID=107327 RepID=UPI00186BA20F|nr:radical SAM protein [Pseudoalteromonas ulvae]MBE0363594.1 oxygen-independent coproporphyrinogen III oxidase [Pseudoalteromonas ulvae UL12]